MTARTCAHCQQPRPVEFSLAAKNGELLTMVSCSRCERRTWYADGHEVDREQMLALTAGKADFVVTPSGRRSRAAARR